MHALVCQGNGKYYVSAVFGYYRDITATDDYQRYLQSIHKPYWIVWDEDKKRLIRWLAMVPNTKYLIPQILIVDSRQDNWNKDPYWNDSTIILHDGFIYFVDDEITSIDQIRLGHCHFKAQHMQYRIIPN